MPSNYEVTRKLKQLEIKNQESTYSIAGDASARHDEHGIGLVYSHC